MVCRGQKHRLDLLVSVGGAALGPVGTDRADVQRQDEDDEEAQVPGQQRAEQNHALLLPEVSVAMQQEESQEEDQDDLQAERRAAHGAAAPPAGHSAACSRAKHTGRTNPSQNGTNWDLSRRQPIKIMIKILYCDTTSEPVPSDWSGSAQIGLVLDRTCPSPYMFKGTGFKVQFGSDEHNLDLLSGPISSLVPAAS